MFLEITDEHQRLASAMGIGIEELVECINTLCSPYFIDVDIAANGIQQVMLGLPYEAPKKAKQMVMCDHRPCNDPGHPRFGNSRRARARRRRSDIPPPERASMSEGVSLTRIGEDRLVSRVCDDAHRIVSTSSSK